MEEKGGLRGNTFEGIFFSEQAPPPGARRLGRVTVEISRQNSNLLEVKARLAQQARAKGANAVAGFVYGQRAHRGLRLLTHRWDTESWHGGGEAVRL
jgi:hypothetical protein